MITEYHLEYQKVKGNTLSKVVRTGHSSDSGLDIYIPDNYVIEGKSQMKITLGIKCRVTRRTVFSYPEGRKVITSLEPSAFELFPRSSISKTPLRLSNSIGLIDMDYRGELMAYVDNISENDYVVESQTKLFQLVNPLRIPWSSVKEVDSLDETERGEGGFGSTGL